MRYIALVLAGSAAFVGSLATGASAQSSVAVAGFGGHKASGFPTAGLTAAPVFRKRGPPRISPHIGLPGISGFPTYSAHRRGHSGGRQHHRARGEWFGFDIGYWGYGDSDGYANTIPTADDYGFFSAGEGVTATDDRPIYHYDRGYPYEWYSPQANGARTAAGLRCRVQRVWDDAQRKEAAVRICGRN